ncbi:MAG: NUDIX domain-containing protein [Pseudomonadota bacterium]
MKYCPMCGTPLGVYPINGRERYACASNQCGWVHWNNPIPVVAAIVEHEGAVALVRNIGWPRHWYGLVTGFLESGEMPEQGILREVEEELGLKAELQSYIGMYEFYQANQLLIAYHVTVDSRDFELEVEEIADARWVGMENLTPWSAGTGRALQDWLKTRGYDKELVDDFAQAGKMNR